MGFKTNAEAFRDVTIANSAFVEEQYERFQKNPDELDPSWKELFSSSENSFQNVIQVIEGRSTAIIGLIDAYRTFGHLKAKIDPLNHSIDENPWQLNLDHFGLTQADLSSLFPTQGILTSPEAPLSEILAALEAIYCGTIGFEYMSIGRKDVESWVQSQIEPSGHKEKLSLEQKKMILHNLNKSELFEVFLHTKYTGQKRFSLEGGETLIPILAAIIDKGAEAGVEEFYLGMAHRGRLNVLSNILNKSYSLIFSEFDENYVPEFFADESGDVKYHKGFLSENLSSHGHKIQIVLTPNPSHLEAVDPVIEGQVYAKQLLAGMPGGKKKVVPILIHGDAALAGQGVVYETLQLQALEGYSTGGTLHLVINNQIGFTTIPEDSRSTRYCTDIANTFGAPTFHVNAEDPEACFFATCLAVELRQKFECDVFIDMICYRKYGHNEGDEPAFTQPQKYALIANKRSIREIYRDLLIQQGFLEKKICEELETEFKASLQKELQQIKNAPKRTGSEQGSSSLKESVFHHIQTGVSLAELQQITAAACRVPEGFALHPKLARLLADRVLMVSGGKTLKPIDWGMAEMLAIGSLLWEGFGVRLSGQDSCRGTFSHRHAVWIDQKQETSYCPLKNLKADQGRFEVFNSSLSEFAVLGFEFGYTLANPSVLVLWEAQFGDFCNGAQVIIDQFISTGEQKWGQQSGLTLLLPHGYEGQGPEHSSARIERFLTLAGQNNLRIVNCSTPAQFFHVLRRQQLLNEKKPLAIFTPKALLRHPACVSQTEDLVMGSFLEILDDPKSLNNVKHVIICSGHVYYDLIAEREKLLNDTVAILRVEQLYPFNKERMKELLDKYRGFERLDWVQEEPSNMGPGVYMGEMLRDILPSDVSFRSFARPHSASPAVGSYHVHKKQLAELMSTVFDKEQPSIFKIASQTQAKS
ncbi:MAG: 2-oxoglutarate dehydrogenase E1 component [Parachlamydiaceae bacterium]|nr:2-oxoglutarate dehydrogenase E1 component [Parachlamydiaceae bacterium]